MIYKAISVIQPYATLIINGSKHNETRSYNTNYRGRVLIHASKTMPENYMKFDELNDVQKCAFKNCGINSQYEIDQLIRGYIIGSIDIVDCIKTNSSFVEGLNNVEKYLGDFSDNRYAWVLRNPIIYDKPIIARGYTMLWNYETEEILK